VLKLLRKLMINFAIISLFLIASCKDYQNINFNPDFYIGSYEEQAIKNEYGKIVYANEIKFNEFSCLSKEKVLELSDLIKDAKIPKEVKTILKKLDRRKFVNNVKPFISN